MRFVVKPNLSRRIFHNSRGFLTEAKAIAGKDVECWIEVIRNAPNLYTIRAGSVWLNSQSREGCLDLCRDMVKAEEKGQS